MTEIQKRKAEKFLDNIYKNYCRSSTNENEINYLSARNLLSYIGLYWHRDKQGKHHIF